MANNTPYDSREDTLAHIHLVQSYLSKVVTNLWQRAIVHDQSKLEEPEKSAFDIATPKLKAMTFGSEEYKESLKELGVALDHHYAHNSHHPQFYENGINGMSAFDLLEMCVDWVAATKRHADGDIWKSIEINKERFNISDQTADIIRNTITEILNER